MLTFIFDSDFFKEIKQQRIEFPCVLLLNHSPLFSLPQYGYNRKLMYHHLHFFNLIT